MFLSQKPFYFLTNRENNYTEVHAGGKSQVYLPDSFERLTTRQIENKKRSLTVKMLSWALFNPKKMTAIDYRMCFTKTLDIIGIVFVSYFAGRIFRRFVNRINAPFLQSMLQDNLVTLDTIKSFASNSLSIFLAYKFVKTSISQPYLYDLALEYRHNFDKEGYYKSSNCSAWLSELQSQRFV